ncbi:MAG: type I phosphomannose isomerase catalytic subunit [Gemmataceae bacterium]
MRSPLRFQPYLRPMVWGGRALGEKIGKLLPTADAYGESWEVSDHASHHSVVSHGPLQGLTLRSLMIHHRAALVGDWSAPLFPWLIKFLDCHDWLSVQVHPDEQAVRTLLPGENSKTEAWFILDVQPGARVYAGLRPEVDATTFERAVLKGTVADCLHSFQPKPGDCIFLPAGTVHAVGGGVLMAEVQQTSDATFRLFDWNRTGPDGMVRQLHLPQGLASMNWQAGPIAPVRVHDYGPAEYPLCQSLVRCRYFHLDYIRQAEPFLFGGTGRTIAIIGLHGKAEVHCHEGPMNFTIGSTLLYPASCPSTWIVPQDEIGLLVTTLPSPDDAA